MEYDDRIRRKAFLSVFMFRLESFISSGETKLQHTTSIYTPCRDRVHIAKGRGDAKSATYWPGKGNAAPLLYNIMSIHVGSDRDIMTSLYL